MTAEEHRTIGRILDFPECCVEQWISDLENPHAPPQGDARGVIVERDRTVEEVEGLVEQLRDTGIPFVLTSRGWTVEGWGEFRKAYVPCDAHVGTAGWSA